VGDWAFTGLSVTDEGVLSRLLLIAGAVILLLGIAGIAVPYFTTEQTKDVADVGPLHVHATEQQSHSIPPLLSDAAVAVGVVLMGVGLVGRR
jgi:hypothetical protein